MHRHGRRTREWLVAALLLVAACGTGTKTPAPAQSGQPGDGVASAVEQIKKDVKIPVRVPAQFPDMGQGQQPIHASVESAKADAYAIILGTAAGCAGGNYCRLGTIAAEKVTGDTPPLRGGKRVSLQGGIVGYFFFNECGATCPDNTVVWQQDGVRYTVGIKSGREEQLIEVANATIAR